MTTKDIKKAISEIDKTELIKNISIIAIILYPIFVLLLREIIKEDNLANYITYFIIGILFIPGIVMMFLKDRKKSIMMLGAFLITVTINYIFHLNTFGESIHMVIKNFITCYLMFMIVVTIKNKEMFFKSLKIGGYISIILTLLYTIIMQNNKLELFQNGLSIQLILMVFLPINLIYLFKEKGIFNIVFTIIGLIIISCFSSRTIIFAIWTLTLLLTAIYYIKWFRNINNRKLKIIMTTVTVIILLLIVLTLINIQNIATSAYNFLNERGIYIRSLRLLSEGKYISHSSGRTDSVYPEMINKILENPIIGKGIGMDRVIINDFEYYAHNIILELFVSYGIIVGGIIIIAIIILIIKALKTPYRAFIIGLIFSGLIILLLTTSYTVYRGFWILLGVLINLCFFKDKEEN